MGSRSMQPISKLAAYCGDGNPVIVEEFRPAHLGRCELGPRAGWRAAGWRKRASRSWLRKLACEGVTHIAIDAGRGRVADFSIAELLSR